jgi:hypothetical protein
MKRHKNYLKLPKPKTESMKRNYFSLLWGKAVEQPAGNLPILTFYL